MSNVRHQRVTRPDSYAVPSFPLFSVISSQSLANVVTWAMNWNKTHSADRSYQPWTDPRFAKR